MFAGFSNYCVLALAECAGSKRHSRCPPGHVVREDLLSLRPSTKDLLRLTRLLSKRPAATDGAGVEVRTAVDLPHSVTAPNAMNREPEPIDTTAAGLAGTAWVLRLSGARRWRGALGSIKVAARRVSDGTRSRVRAGLHA